MSNDLNIGIKDASAFFEAVSRLTAEIYPAGKHPDIDLSHFVKGVVATRGNKIVTTIAFYINPHIRYRGAPCAFFGNFESLNDAEAVSDAMTMIRGLAREWFFRTLIGPVNGTTTGEYRIAIHSPRQPFFLEPVHPAYYPDLLKSCGASIAETYYSAVDTAPKEHDPRWKSARAAFEKKGIVFRNLKIENFRSELEGLHTLCMEAFCDNVLFSPSSKVSFVERYMKLTPYIDPAYVFIAEEKGALVGFAFCLPDHLNKAEKGIIIKTIARKPGFRYTGLGNVFAGLITDRAITDGADYLIHALMHRRNTSMNLSATFTGEQFRQYVLYRLHL